MKNLPYEQALTILRRTPFDDLRRDYGSLNAAWEVATCLLHDAERLEDERAIRLAKETQEPAGEWLARCLGRSVVLH